MIDCYLNLGSEWWWVSTSGYSYRPVWDLGIFVEVDHEVAVS